LTWTTRYLLRAVTQYYSNCHGERSVAIWWW